MKHSISFLRQQAYNEHAKNKTSFTVAAFVPTANENVLEVHTSVTFNREGAKEDFRIALIRHPDAVAVIGHDPKGRIFKEKTTRNDSSVKYTRCHYD